MDDLFRNAERNLSDLGELQPLAERARPHDFESFVGQAKALGTGHLLKQLLESKNLPSLIFWGPPGSGKTSLAQLIALKAQWPFVNRSAIDTGAKELKLEGERAREHFVGYRERTILFIDEIHRLNRAQQDCLLPYVEKGYLVLIGATTENPSFELNSALLSRCQVVVFETLAEKEIEKILNRGLELLDQKLKWDGFSGDDLKSKIVDRASGDARRALNILENAYEYFLQKGRRPLTSADIEAALQNIPSRYDKSRDMHYDTISAFIKSIRGSDPDAALYYLARMLKAGENPLFIARRLVILASEDVGNADPRAVQVAVAVKDAVDFVGLPEAAISLAQGVSYLASCPKSNRSYLGFRKAQALAEQFPDLEIPLSIRNAPTRLMRELGYGDDYKYAHDSETGITSQTFLPERLKGTVLYEPSDHGQEKNIKIYLDWVKSQRPK